MLADREVTRLTVIATVPDADGVLIAADSCRTNEPDGDRREDVMKLCAHPVQCLAWGCSGSVSVSDQFTAWLRREAWPPNDLDAFWKRVADHLAALNGQAVKRAAKSGSPDHMTVRAEALLAAWHEGIS